MHAATLAIILCMHCQKNFPVSSGGSFAADQNNGKHIHFVA